MYDHPLLLYYSATIQLCRLQNVFYSRCLVGDPSGKSFGDVAFMEHHNLESNIERKMYTMRKVIGMNLIDINVWYVWWTGLNTSGWAEGWLPLDFELLCSDGSRAPLTEWKTCNLGAVPPNIVMTRPVLTARIYDLLMKSQVCTLKL